MYRVTTLTRWRNRRVSCCAAAAAVLLFCGLVADAAENGNWSDLREKREEVFAFAVKPLVTRAGDAVSIAFETKAFCDVTVAIEDEQGKVVRHLVSGLLGPNAPEPFQKNSKRQLIAWDGKNDREQYVDNKEALAVRVSLGLKPQFERTIFWHPMKRASDHGLDAPMFAAAPEGVYVYDGGLSFDHVRLFDHDGNYVRTVYPFPGDKVEKVDGLFWHTAQQDGKRFPVKPNAQQSTMLTSGTTAWPIRYKDGVYSGGPNTLVHYGQGGRAASALAVRDGRVALACLRLNRFSTDGAGAGAPVSGPKVCFEDKSFRNPHNLGPAAAQNEIRSDRFAAGVLPPLRIALSPDKKWLYLTRYQKTTYSQFSGSWSFWRHAVMRMPYDGSEPPQLFAGENETAGADEGHFNMPAGIDCDEQGNVYVADYGNNRVQVFSPEGKVLRSIRAEQPVEVCIHRTTGELYVFCWPLLPPEGRGGPYARMVAEPRAKGKSPCNLLKFSNDASPRLLARYELPLGSAGEGPGTDEGMRATLDPWSKPLAVWLTPGVVPQGSGKARNWPPTGILLLKEKDGKFEIARDFDGEARKAIGKIQPPTCFNQRLYVNPATGKLYVAEETWACAGVEGWTFDRLLEADPESGTIREVKLPLGKVEDLAFDADGAVYLRPYPAVVRYDFATWREIPFDYGEEMTLGMRQVISALVLPCNQGWHHGGMGVSLKGDIAIGCLYTYQPKNRSDEKFAVDGGQKYSPKLYPGRNTVYAYGAIYVHVWNKYGKLIHEDAVPGLGGSHGVEIDRDDNVYVLAAGRQIIGGVPYYNDYSCTLIKAAPGKAKIVSDGPMPVPLPPEQHPARPPDMDKTLGRAWVDGAEWMFGGVGWEGKKGIGCACWNCRFDLDYFKRSFAPESDRYSVAVLDSNGNVITRVGRYGNVDDGLPIVRTGGPPNPRSIGGDEVSLHTAWYVATQTDRRLFIADAGNYRLLSVKLGYATEEKILLKDVMDEAKE